MKYEQQEIRREDGKRIGRVDDGVLTLYCNYTEDPCPEHLESLGFQKVKGKYVYKSDRGNKEPLGKGADAKSKKAAPAPVSKP